MSELRINPSTVLRIDAEQSRSIKNKELRNEKELLELIKEEVNIRKITFDGKIKKAIELNIKITKELKEEGIVRDIIRHIQNMRKVTGLTPKDKIDIGYMVLNRGLERILKKNKKIIQRQALAKEFTEKKEKKVYALEKEIKLDGKGVNIFIRKVEENTNQ